jgi:hypothetical protein
MKIGSAGSGSIHNAPPDRRIVNPAGGGKGAPFGGSSNFCGVEAAYGGEKRSKMHNSCG